VSRHHNMCISQRSRVNFFGSPSLCNPVSMFVVHSDLFCVSALAPANKPPNSRPPRPPSPLLMSQATASWVPVSLSPPAFGNRQRSLRKLSLASTISTQARKQNCCFTRSSSCTLSSTATSVTVATSSGGELAQRLSWRLVHPRPDV